MKKIFSFILVFITVLTLNAQNKKSTSLVIRGESKIFMQPDIMEININITSKNGDYKLCLSENIDKLTSFKEMLKAASIKSLSIKDVSQRVREDMKYIKGDNKFIGYIANYNVILKLSAGTNEINELMKVLRNSGFALNYNAIFKLSEKLLLESETELLKKAIADATQKAGIIASTCNMKLQSILDIKYRVEGSAGFSPRLQYRGMNASYSQSDQAFSDPAKIELTDSVNITWLLK